MNPYLNRHVYLSLAVLICSMSVLGVGCAPSLRGALNADTLNKPVSKGLTIKVDIEASEIIWNHPVPVSEFRPRQLRREIGEALENALNGERGVTVGSEGYLPARYLLEVHEIESNFTWLVLPCFVYFTVFGCPTHSLDADITLTMEYQGKIYSTSVEGSATFNLYTLLLYSGRNEVSPVVDGIRRAIRRLAKQMRNDRRVSRAPRAYESLTSRLRSQPIHQALIARGGE